LQIQIVDHWIDRRASRRIGPSQRDPEWFCGIGNFALYGNYLTGV